MDAVVERYRADAGPEARERFELVCATDAVRARRWSGEPLDIGRRDGCYPLFSSVGALAAAPHGDLVLRRTIRRIGLLDRTAVFDQDGVLHDRIETILQRLAATSPSPAAARIEERLTDARSKALRMIRATRVRGSTALGLDILHRLPASWMDYDPSPDCGGFNMAVAFVQEFPRGDRSTANYDAVAQRLSAESDPPDGAIIHTAGFTGDGRFRIFEVWESREHLQRFLDERLMPIVREVTAGPDVQPPSQDTYELHDLVKP